MDGRGMGFQRIEQLAEKDGRKAKSMAGDVVTSRVTFSCSALHVLKIGTKKLLGSPRTASWNIRGWSLFGEVQQMAG